MFETNFRLPDKRALILFYFTFYPSEVHKKKENILLSFRLGATHLSNIVKR